MHKQAIYALAYPVFNPEEQVTPEHFWKLDAGRITAGLTVNIGME